MAQFDEARIRENVAEHWNELVELLNQKIALKSISAQGIAGEQMKRSADFVAEQFQKLGVDAKVEQAVTEDGKPGAWEVIGSLVVDENAPTVLLYAHHDVQPVPGPEGWTSEPFVGTVQGDRLYGRGSCDDGGGIIMHVGALQALGKELNVNIKLFIEGEEEMGSPSFIPFIEAHRDEFEADVIIVADSGNWAPEIPSLTTSLRGNATCDVHVRVLKHPVHSGQYGGPILDAVTLASMSIASLYNENGELKVPGIASQEPVGGLQQDVTEESVRKDAGIVDSYKLAGTGSLASRLWTKPSATVIGFDAHPVEGSFNVIAPEATYRLSVRTAPEQDPNEVNAALKAYLESNAPFGAEVEVTPLEAGRGWAMDPTATATKDALEAMREAFDVDPVNMGQGGSIPFIPELQRLFPKAQVLVTGPEDPQSNAHSPNESVSLPGLQKNVVAEALLLAKLGADDAR
ncbi:peptidase [Bifidobacterium dolichotidis]|uniref:Peptidase n=1 Tax=Bifidobacterium dolichotidis TaxID=2306976 RepID=A0A430FTC8_9BIFI|nr:dipeptidase [Bifidobacterium dolichotidis]RSX56154.1 peptidase [Bifidobacterium dolichotidis]